MFSFHSARAKIWVKIMLVVILLLTVGIIIAWTNKDYKITKEEAHSPKYTSQDELFVVNIDGIPKKAKEWHKNPDSYRLSIKGLVSKEMDLSYEDIVGRDDIVTKEVVLECAGNPPNGPLIGKISVTGVPLWNLLNETGVLAGTFKAIFRAPDGFSTDLRIDYIKEAGEDVLLVFEINGEVLSLEHGFPIRLAVKEMYGYKWIKWLEEIVLTNEDYMGYWERRGWPDEPFRDLGGN